jgi:hypothetical protein
MPITILSDSPPAPSGKETLAGIVTTRFSRFADLMGLIGWNIRLQWTPVGDRKVMATTAEPEYYQATIDVDLNDVDIEYLDEYIRHELFHIILWQYTEAALAFTLKRTRTTINKLEERTVSDLERMPLWAFVPSGTPG